MVKLNQNQTVFLRIEIDTQLWTKMMTHIAEIVETGHFLLNKDGIRFAELDGAHICLCAFFLSKADCIQYEFIATDPDPNSEQYAMDISDLVRGLKGIWVIRTKKNKKGNITGKNETITIEFGNKGWYITTDNTKIFLHCINVDNYCVKSVEALDSIKYQNKIELSVAELKYGYKACRNYADTIQLQLHAKEKALYFYTKGDGGIFQYNPTIISFQCDDLPQDGSDSLCNNYSNVYLEQILKKFYQKTVTVYISPDQPLKFEFQIGTKSWGLLYLAPRVEESTIDD